MDGNNTMKIHIGIREITLINESEKSIWYLLIMGNKSSDVILKEMKSGEQIKADGIRYLQNTLLCHTSLNIVKFDRHHVSRVTGFNLNQQP